MLSHYLEEKEKPTWFNQAGQRLLLIRIFYWRAKEPIPCPVNRAKQPAKTQPENNKNKHRFKSPKHGNNEAVSFGCITV